MKRYLIVGATTAVLALQGCAAPGAANTASTPILEPQRQDLQVRRGTVIDVQAIRLDEPATGGKRQLASVGGALIGAVAGGPLGIGSLFGAVGGYFSGDAAADHFWRGTDTANQAVIKVDGGVETALTQDPDKQTLSPGQRVMLIGVGNNVRVTPVVAPIK